MPSYIYKATTHTDFSDSYMHALGMTGEQMQSVNNQYEFDKKADRAAVIKSIHDHIDQAAQSRDYDDINAIAKYMGYANPYRAECEALGLWCASCWRKYYEIELLVSGGGAQPTNLIAELPLLVFS